MLTPRCLLRRTPYYNPYDLVVVTPEEADPEIHFTVSLKQMAQIVRGFVTFMTHGARVRCVPAVWRAHVGSRRVVLRQPFLPPSARLFALPPCHRLQVNFFLCRLMTLFSSASSLHLPVSAATAHPSPPACTPAPGDFVREREFFQALRACRVISQKEMVSSFRRWRTAVVRERFAARRAAVASQLLLLNPAFRSAIQDVHSAIATLNDDHTPRWRRAREDCVSVFVWFLSTNHRCLACRPH